MPVPIPYKKFCSAGSPVLKPANSPARFSTIATTAAIEAHTTYKTEHAISRLRVEGVKALIIFLVYCSTPVSPESRLLIAAQRCTPRTPSLRTAVPHCGASPSPASGRALLPSGAVLGVTFCLTPVLLRCDTQAPQCLWRLRFVDYLRRFLNRQ